MLHRRASALALIALSLASRAASAQPAGGRCPADAIERLHREAPTFLVEVHARQGAAASIGVVVAPDRVVVPVAGVIDESWPITVYLPGGARSAARVRHQSAERNLALLVLESPPPGLAARPVARRPAIGAPLLTIGAPLHEGEAVSWELREATLTNALGSRLVASPPPPSGAPLLTCAGELVGIQSSATLSELESRILLAPSPASAIEAASLDDLIGAPEVAPPRGQLEGLGGVQATFSLRSSEQGVGLKLKLIEVGFAPSLFVALRAGGQWLSPRERAPSEGVTEESRWRFQTEGVVGYRLRLGGGSPGRGFFHLDVVPVLGAASRTDATRLTRLGPSRTTVRDFSTEHHVDPVAGVSVGALRGHLSYLFQLDTGDVSRSIHTIGLGYGF